MTNNINFVGIDAIDFDIAKLQLPIKTLAKARNIEPEKLEKGLGLLNMTLPDVHQDSVVFGANAVTNLIRNQGLDLSAISRIYVGTESGIDNSKPVASFILEISTLLFWVGSMSIGEPSKNH